MTAWADVIRQAFIARHIIDVHSAHPETLARCAYEHCKLGRDVISRFASGRTRLAASSLTPYPWPDELTLFAREYRWAAAPSNARRFMDAPSQLAPNQPVDEPTVLRRAFSHLEASASETPDCLFERLFLQYLRVKTTIFALLVHQPGEHGLRKFLEHFSQIKVYAPEAERVAPRQPVERGLDVHSTEYRVAPDAWFKMRRRPGAHIEEPVHEAGPHREAAWIIHFKRSDPGNGLPLYGTDVRRIESEADQIVRFLSARPADLQFLRGLDVCGVEDAQPLWVSAPSLRRVRRASWRVARNASVRLQPLRLSIHTGEDFLWLTSGMRAIAEPFQWRLIERGDRIGHGIAVTLEPDGWWDRSDGRVIEVKRIDRLLDLAFLGEYALPRTDGEQEWLRLNIRKLVGDLRLQTRQGGGDADLVATATRFWTCLGSRVSRRILSPSASVRKLGNLHEHWLQAYLWNRSTQQRASEILHLKVANDHFEEVNRHGARSHRVERDLLVKARKRLIRELARWQVCIESNPTSNLVVGSLDAMAAQDFLQRRPTAVCEEGDETLTWTISTDDPITFSTTLADEYAYAWAGMVLREKNPYDPSYARALLDEAAATSMRMRFSIPDELDESWKGAHAKRPADASRRR